MLERVDCILLSVFGEGVFVGSSTASAVPRTLRAMRCLSASLISSGREVFVELYALVDLGRLFFMSKKKRGFVCFSSFAIAPKTLTTTQPHRVVPSVTEACSPRDRLAGRMGPESICASQGELLLTVLLAFVCRQNMKTTRS
jgi:hypothetical protein